MTDALLYFQPFTMPDGTTRRAIVERVPECRPKDSGVNEDSWTLHWSDDLGFFYWRTDRGDSDPFENQEESGGVVAALCCCAVANYVMDNSYSIGRCSAGYRAFRLDGEGEDITGPTIHHALILASHTIADQQGVKA